MCPNRDPVLPYKVRLVLVIATVLIGTVTALKLATLSLGLQLDLNIVGWTVATLYIMGREL